MNLPVVSIIIPFKFGSSKKYLERRVESLISQTLPKECETIFVDASLAPLDKFKQTSNKTLKYIHSPQPKIFSLAKARNDGAIVANGKYLFFLDVDFIWHNEFLGSLTTFIHEKLSHNDSPVFTMLPCLFLTKEATELSLNNKSLSFFHLVRNDALLGNRKLVETIAIVSSTIIVKKDVFYKLGGFNESYIGYGCEEFDLLHRLSNISSIGAKPKDYFINEVEPAPINYKGFRKYFLYYGLPNLFTDFFLLHQYHSRPILDQFYLQRTKNDKKLLRNMKKYDAGYALPTINSIINNNPITLGCNKNLPDLETFIKNTQCQAGFPLKEYPGLIMDTNYQYGRKSPLARRLRKLIRHPVKYFRDAKSIRR